MVSFLSLQSPVRVNRRMLIFSEVQQAVTSWTAHQSSTDRIKTYMGQTIIHSTHLHTSQFSIQEFGREEKKHIIQKKTHHIQAEHLISTQKG